MTVGAFVSGVAGGVAAAVLVSGAVGVVGGALVVDAVMLPVSTVGGRGGFVAMLVSGGGGGVTLAVFAGG